MDEVVEQPKRKRGRPRLCKEISITDAKQKVVDENKKLYEGLDDDLLIDEEKQDKFKSAETINNDVSGKENKIDETSILDDLKDIDVINSEKEQYKKIDNNILKRVCDLTGKEENYVKDKCKSVTYEQFIDNLVSLFEESCLSYHKYSVGDCVWIPMESVDNTQNGFGEIKVNFFRKPKNVKVNKIIYANKICYMFVGFSKLVVLEKYCFGSEEECQKVCDELNSNR